MWKETESCPDIKFKSCSVIKTRVKGLSCHFIWNNQKIRENRWPNESHLFHFICKRLVFLEMTKSLLYESPKNWCKQGKVLKDLQTLTLEASLGLLSYGGTAKQHPFLLFTFRIFSFLLDPQSNLKNMCSVIIFKLLFLLVYIWLN